MNYNNDKLNEIYRDTWPNLGWAKRMNEDNLPVPDDMCWVNLTKEEIEELRSKKHTLTEYGRKQLRKLMTHEEMLEEAARREAMAMEAVEKLYEENGDALKQLAEIEKEEREESDDDFFGQLGYLNRMEKEEAEQKVAREKVMQIAVGAIDKYSEALKELAATEKEELKQQLEALKKENFQKVADYCMEEYTQKYGEMPEDEYWVYMVADYFATGEGTTTCLMITQATPYGDDYPSEGPDKYKPVNSQAYRAVRKFHKQFGTWMLHGLKFLPKHEFYTQCAYFIPPAMMKLANAKCFKEFYNEVHYNFS
jgi:hypothetical protein